MSLQIMDLVPSEDKIDSMLSMLPTEPMDASMSLRSPLLPLSGLEDPSLVTESFDLDGFSSYARIVSLLLDAFLLDRIVAKAHPWALRHFIALSLYAEEAVDLPNNSSEVFDTKAVSSSVLRQLVYKVQQVTTYVLSDAGDEWGWHQKVTAACIDLKVRHEVGETGKFVVSLFRATGSNDNPRDARILHTILQHILSHTSKEEGELWMGICRKFEAKGEKAFSLSSAQCSRILGSSFCLYGCSSLCRWVRFRTPKAGSLSQRACVQRDGRAPRKDQQ